MEIRRLTSILLAAVGSMVTVCGVVLAVANQSLFDEDEVESTSRKIVEDRDVKRLINREVTDRVVEIGGLEDQRDLVQPFVALILEDPRVEDQVVDGVMAAHDLLINGSGETIVFNLIDMAEQVRERVVDVVPALDDRLPPADDLLSFELFRRHDLPKLFDLINTIRQAGWWFLASGILLMVSAVVLGPGRFSIVGLASLVTVVGMFLAATWISMASDHAVDAVDDQLSRRVARLATDEYLADLDHAAIAVIIVALIGVVVGIGGSWILGALWPERSWAHRTKVVS